MIIQTYIELDEFILIADGISMRPAIEPGDKLIVKKHTSYKIGDIVVFICLKTKANNIIAAHRIINKSKNKYFTKGDNQDFCDPPICSEYILGKVEEILRKKDYG